MYLTLFACVCRYDAAELNSGFTMKQPKAFADRIHRVISLGLGVDPNAPVPEAEPEVYSSLCPSFCVSLLFTMCCLQVEDEPEPAKEEAPAEEASKDEL